MTTAAASKGTVGGVAHPRTDQGLRSNETRKSRYAPLWSEWNETDVNGESWDVGSVKKKDTAAGKARVELKSASSIGTHGFEDPEGKVELPPAMKVDQWRRPIDFLPPDRPPIIVDPDLGMQNFDLVTPNEHLHHSETMRNIIGQIASLWDICRQERKSGGSPSEYSGDTNLAVLSGRTWRPWEHIYALNKVSKLPFITPYNPAGKYAVRLFFLGTWRKIIVDDTIPFDSKNRCLLPQTALPYELWPLILTKALLKIIALDFRTPSIYPEYNETSIIHCLTGWLPEPIPLKYSHATKVWEFLRYDRSNRLILENETGVNKTEQQNPASPPPTFGPVPLFKWPDSKTDSPDDSLLLNDQSGHPDDSGTETMTKKSDDKSAKKGGAPVAAASSKDAAAKSATGKETRLGGGPSTNTSKDTKKLTGAGRGGTIEDPTAVVDDQTLPEAPKIIVFATIPHLEPSRLSSYGETADRSERLRRYNLNDTFSTSVLLTCIRDLPLEPPPPPEYIPPWKLIRPKKPKVLPHAEPVVPQEPKPDRWIEISSPYINYPTASTLNMGTATPAHGTTSRLTHSATHSTVADVPEIIEVDEEGDIENGESRPEIDIELIRSEKSPEVTKNIEAISPSKELNAAASPETPEDSARGTGSKLKRERSADKNKGLRKLAGSKLDVLGGKPSSDAVSVKSRGGESEQNLTPMDIHAPANTAEHQDSQSKSNEANPAQLTTQAKKNYITPKIWMDFDDFCSCFTTITVYHNPRGYQFAHKHTEVKPSVITAVKEKKKETNPTTSQQLPNLQDDKSPLYLFVDSPRDRLKKNIELIVGLTSLSRWVDSSVNEGPSPFGTTMPTIPDRSGRGGASNEKASAELSPARGAGRRRTSTIDTIPQTPGPHVSLQDASIAEMSQKEIIPQPSSLIAEVYSWKSLSMGQPILRLHTTTTKAAFLTLPPGRHVLKFSVGCILASHLQIMSDTNDFTFGDEDLLLSKIVSVPEDAEFTNRAEELFLTVDEAVQNFINPGQYDYKLQEIFRSYCANASPLSNLTIHTCWNAFNQALYSTLRLAYTAPGQALTPDIQFAWRCFTNDLTTPDIMGIYEARRPSTSGASRGSARAGNAPGAAGTSTATAAATTTAKKTGAGKDKGADDKGANKQQTQLSASMSMTELQEESIPEWLNRDLSANEMESIISIQKAARGYLQRRILAARIPGSEKNLSTQKVLQQSMTLLKADAAKSAIVLFRNLMISKPQLIQCFPFRADDWNMVTYHDYLGQYQDQPANIWFTMFREIFYVVEDGFVYCKLLSHAQNSLLRVINNDTYEETPIIFNRLAPSLFTRNKLGYTVFAEGISSDQPLISGRFRLRLLTSYTHLPEPRLEQITSTFATKEIKDYYVPNNQQVICRYRVTVADDINQTGRSYHLASIHFSTSKPDVLIRLTILNNNDEVVTVEGKGSVVLPAFLFLRDVTTAASNSVQAPAQSTQPLSRPPSKTGGTTKKESNKNTGGTTQRGSVAESPGIGSGRSEKERTGSDKRSRSSSRTGLIADEEEKLHKYVIQATVLRKTWPLTQTQWQFVDNLKEQEKNELKIFNRQPSASKAEGGVGGAGAGSKKGGQASTSAAGAASKGKGASAASGTGKGGTSGSGRPGTGKGTAEKAIDTSKPHWILRVVSDGDKADELTIKKDTERNEELINMKKAWETHEAGRSQKAMKARQKFLDSLQPKPEERPSSSALDGATKRPESRAGDETSTTTTPTTGTATEQPQPQHTPKQVSATAAPTPKKSASGAGSKKVAPKDDATKQAEPVPQQELTVPSPATDEPLLDQPPPSRPKIILPPLDIKPFFKQKMLSDEPIILDPLFEQEDLRRRQAEFFEYAKYAKEIQQSRDEDHNNRYKEKIRQLEEYVDLQAKIDQSRRTINEPREAFRQRFLEVERKRLAELAAQEQELIAAAEKAKAAAAPAKGKGSAGKKGKK